MSDALDTLLAGSAVERRAALAEVLAGPEGPRRLEAAMIDLLRDAGDEVLAALAAGLAPFRCEAEAARVLEALARRGGAVRAAALRALRGDAAAVGTGRDRGAGGESSRAAALDLGGASSADGPPFGPPFASGPS